MIEQVLYRRTVEQGYNEYCSHGLSKEEAHSVNVIMDTVASDIGDLGSGADSPFMLYHFEAMHRFCLAIFQREFSKGRSNSVNHGLLIEEDEYKELVKKPEQIWGFTNKNFLSRKVNRREEMFALKTLDVLKNSELSKDFIFREYGLNNDEYLKFLNSIYTSLSKNKNYSYGIRIDNSKDANKVMRHLGYLIMSMLPYELRDKISFCSRSVPESIGVTFQILQEKDSEKTDITYDMNLGKCLINNISVEITDFYLKDLLSMADAALRDYFGILAEFKDELKLSENSESEYVISKLLKLSQNPSMFASETAEAQFTFINDVFLLPTSNMDVINSIVVRLLPFVDSNHYMEAFNINFGLYRKLNSEKSFDRKIMTQIEENLIQNYSNATIEEKKQLFILVFDSEKEHIRARAILEKFVQINKMELDILLVNKYLQLYEEFFKTEWKSILYCKIVGVFKASDISVKEQIWNYMYNSVNSDFGKSFIYNILCDEDEAFHKVVFDNLISLFIKSQNSQFKELCHSCIHNVIQRENDGYRLKVLQKYNDVDEVESSLWIETYNAIQDYKKAGKNIEFLRCLKDKYYKSSNPKICELYLEYMGYVSISELENIIVQYSRQAKPSEREKRLLNKVICLLTKDKKKISITVLKVLTTIVEDEAVNELASYISNLYLSVPSNNSIEIYEFLETEQKRLFNNTYLNKESLSSFDYYYASKLDNRILKDDKKLVSILQYLEKLKYHEESFTKINLIYQKWIKQETETAECDYECYLKCKELCNRISAFSHTQFGNQYYIQLRAQIQDCFWKSSDINTFDYERCGIYKANSIVYDQKFKQHENHVLAESISGLIEDSYTNWDKVYEVLLSKKYIPQDNIRNQITRDFIKKYQNYGMSVSDPDYIAFISVNKNNFKMDYARLFDGLQKYNYRIDEKVIRRMKIFNYIKVSDQLRKKIYEYKNYQSDNPSYGEVVKGLFFEQITVLFLLFANNIFRIFVIKMSGNLKTKNLFLFCNYMGYILLIVLVASISLLLMKRANMRKSPKYDTVVFGLLSANMLISSIAILLSVKFNKIFICLPATIVFMAVAIILNIRAMDIIVKPKKKEIKGKDNKFAAKR